MSDDAPFTLTSEILLQAYRQGIFPMADSAEDENLYWYQPQMRGQLSIENLHIPRRLLKTLKTTPLEVSFNEDFDAVIRACAAHTADRPKTWINEEIITLFNTLHEQGHAHSVEIWDKNSNLVGGLYGLQIGAVFCGESMFSTVRDASKIALVSLVARLWHQGFKVLDTQFVNDHLLQFGVYEVSHETYVDTLHKYADAHALFAPIKKPHKEVLKEYLEFRQNQKE